MSLLGRIEEQSRKAESRCDFDPRRLQEEFRFRSRPQGSRQETEDRRRFLRETVGGDADAFLERILNGNELQSSNYFSRGARAARAVARIQMVDPVENIRGWGTGFLIAPEVLITNHHVLARPEAAAASQAHFLYEKDDSDRDIGPEVFQFDVERLFYTSPELDFTVVALKELSGQPQRFGYLPLLSNLGKALEGEWLTILQHPGGQRKQVAARENRLLKRTDTLLWYSTDTLGGSSGSPVTNNDWFVVALHHAGIPVRRDGKIQALDGADWDGNDESQIHWEANEGIRASVIANELKRSRPNHPLLVPMYAATPESARVGGEAGGRTNASRTGLYSVGPTLTTKPMNLKTLTLPLQVEAEVQPDGRIAILRASLSSTASVRAGESALVAEAGDAPGEDFEEATFESPFDPDYSQRPGFQPDFLGQKHVVHLPTLGAMAAHAVPLLHPSANGDKNELKYHNFSVVMHAERRFALYSAANVSMGQRYAMKRPPDVWRTDPRIDAKYQIGNFYYRNNQFDRGHLTRREDLEFGKTPKEALSSAGDTCHWCNCTPMHKKFNQNKETWQGLERHVLEEAIIQDHLNAQVITGPVLEEDDPVYEKTPNIPYPVRFWKIVAGLKSDGTLFSVAFILDQRDAISRFGLDEVAVPIGAFKTFQTKVAEVERLTGLTFTCQSGKVHALRECDPLNGGLPESVRRRVRRRVSPNESAELFGDASPRDYLPITTPAAVYLG